MSKRASQSKPRSVTFEHSLKITARSVVLEPSSTLPFLDLDRLGRGKHDIHVGFVDGPCGKLAVSAHIERGNITRFDVDSCAQTRPSSPEQLRLFQTALAKLRPGKKPSALPLPLAKFVAQPLEGGWHFPCAWLIFWGYVWFCCFKKQGRKIVLGCGVLPFPPTATQ